MENTKNISGGHPNRFRVSTIQYDNGGFDLGENTQPDTPQHGARMSVSNFMNGLMPGKRKSSSFLTPDAYEIQPRRTSRANSIFAEIFSDADCHVVDYNLEAAPRLECYRNSLTVDKYMIRPTLDELHKAKQDCHPALSKGKGEYTGAVKFGWIKGVYIRCLLNIWGVMLFLRMGWMTGQCGIILAIVIVLLSTVVTVITTLSMSAICTNGDVRGGGAYYLISRSLGPEFGGVVGILLFLANAISAAMYIIGAGEAIRDILKEFGKGIVDHPSGANDIRISGIICLLLMMSITGFGMEFENKTQVVLLGILLVAMMDYFVGACFRPKDYQKAEGFVGWSAIVGLENLGPDFRGETFFSVFAVFFPSVTGILAGANISGDLKDPCMAIPRGTFLSIATTSVSYILLVIYLGCTTLRDATGDFNDFVNGTFPNCTNNPCSFGLMNNYQTMKMSSAFGPLIYAGIFAATLSSALVSIVSAPRILQALCVDKVIPWLNWFGKGYGSDNDPRRALVLTFIIAVIFTAIGDLNAVAPIISNFFMAANGLINFSCFHASYVKSPGFRPGFRYYNLWLSLLGALLCVVIMFVMSWITALVTDMFVIGIYIYINKTCPDINWGSSFQGYSYRNALYYLNKLSKVEEHVKNYRPAVLVLTGTVSSRPQLVDLAGHFTKNHGAQICAQITKDPCNWQSRLLMKELNSRWLDERKVKAFYSLVETHSFQEGVNNLIQTVGIGKMKPNILMMGFKENWQTCDVKDTMEYFHTIHETLDANMSICILRISGGTDYSQFFNTEDGFPILKNYKPTDTHLTQPKVKEDVKITLETVPEEEPTAPSSDSISPPPPYISVSSHNGISVLSTEWVTSPEHHDISLQDEGELPSSLLTNPRPDMANRFSRKQEEGNIDVWWLYDDGGLTVLLPYILTTRKRFKDCKLRVFSVAQDNSVLSDEQLNLAILLQKFRIPFQDLNVLSATAEPLNTDSTQKFEKMISKFLTSDDTQKDQATVTRATLNALKNRTNQFLRLRELIEKHSKSSNMIVMTLPLPRREGSTAPLYMAWLDILTEDLPPFLMIRGNQTSVLTFYS